MTESLNPNHPMSQFAQENATKLLALIIWKLRKHCPNLAVEISTGDMEQLASVFSHSGQVPVVACIGRKDGITLQLVDEASGKMLVEQLGDENSPNAKMMSRCMEARKRAPIVADKLLQFRNVNDKELAREAAEILKLLTWEPEA